ncbi:ABC transporter substrate-binding protein [Actinomadura sp. NEAU-AAG7]|uniref:peptide ABC transporter substrate-binding protein n=1 Tax=Actinomadura sp. NEAU-AAG7 TaxID=2839640 RepID=UPI001BE3FEF3|nr:ABC transporter substrate-binding protein [Actinomadura sp. NEAU-AAG7]MBT2212878.1 ABC transporter substrate-binding protein [Actinomadura sp. NEAU-AAG7]
MLLGLGLSSCASSDSETGRSFSYAILEPTHLTPGRETSIQGLYVLDALFDTLTRTDPKGRVANDEAESITSPDRRTWTIRIKPGLSFHNGEPVTAASYVDAWNTAAYGPNGWVNGFYFAHIDGFEAMNPPDPDGGGPKSVPPPSADRLAGLKVLDRRTFRVSLTAPFSQFPTTLAFVGFAPLPRAALANIRQFDRAPIGNGPFRIEGQWENNRQIKLRRYPGYRGIRPARSDGLTFKIYATWETGFTDLRAGRVDVMRSIPAPLIPQARRVLGGRIRSIPSSTMEYLEFPLYDKRFQNPDLRKAISMAIDRQGIVNGVYDGAYRPTGTILAPIIPGFRPNACGQTCTYQPDKARELLRRAGGWQGPLQLSVAGNDSTDRQWMIDVANQLRQNLGITDVRVRAIPQASYLGLLGDRKMSGPYRATWIMDYPSAENYLTFRCTPDNRQGYNGAACRDLLAQGNRAPSPNKAVPYYQRAEDILLTDLPVLPLWNQQDTIAYSKRLSNVNTDPYVAPHVRLDEVTVK